LSTRGQFGDYLNSLGLIGEAVEVGTHRGEFANALLSTWKGRALHCVDPWECLPGYEEQQRLLWGEGDHFFEARTRLRRHGDRARLLRITSENALKNFINGSLDFVFIDGDHRREHVAHDLAGWWEKVRPGGLLAGHDFVQPGESHSWAGEVQAAVLEFAARERVDVQLIIEEGGLPWSYWMEKTSRIDP
jgi:hypothetical protein